MHPRDSDPTRRTYRATITSLDDQVGRIVAALEKRGLLENTLIIFSSDNGGPGKTELFDLIADPGEKDNVAEQNPEVVRDLESRLMAYAKQQKMSEWMKRSRRISARRDKPCRPRLRHRRWRVAAREASSCPRSKRAMPRDVRGRAIR